MEQLRERSKRALTLFLAIVMIMTSLPLDVLAETTYNYKNLSGDKAKFVNKLTPVQIARPNDTAEEFVSDPAQPAIYTLRTDFKAEKGEKYSVNYQPYVASVGAAAKSEEQAKVNKEIKLPDMAGYKKPVGDSFTNSYDAIVKAAKNGQKTSDNGDKFLELREFRYAATTSNITVKHVFQDMEDFNKFTNKDGTITKNDGTVIDAAGKETKYDLKDPDQKEKYKEFVRDHENQKTLIGNTGSTLEVQALQENERPGFVPQVERLKTQVPEDTSDFKIEYRYNRAAYDVVFDTADGTPLPTRTYYYDQEIPKIDENSIPTKIGSEFLGWKPSHDLEGMLDGKKHTFKKGEIIKDSNRNAIVDLGNIYYKKDGNGKIERQNGDPVKQTITNEIQLKMPALKLGDGKSIPREKLTFTAVWKDKEKADFAVQFWAEKADHADNASILDKYDYMGTKVYNNIDVGFQPYLKDMPVNGINFPDLDETRLKKIWKGDKFNRGRNLYLNKFFVYNEKLTDEENKDPKEPSMTKAVSATGKTVYNIYYDRQVYDLYFTKSNAQPEKNTIYPEIWGYDPAKGEAVMLGGPGNLYHYKARFNEMMYKWPNDAKQTKGFTPGYQSFGWGPNYSTPNWPKHLDTPPYRLNADEFLDMENYTSWGGYTKHIDKGDGTTKDLEWFDFKTLSFGIKQDHPSIPHHMDFWMDGFKKDETIIRYDLVRTKADTAGLGYGHRYPIVTGFTPYGYNPRSAWPAIEEGSEENGRVNEDDIDDLNDERDGITLNTCGTYYNNNGMKLPIGQLDFIPHFFSDSDEFGDLKDGGQTFTENGYLQFKYHRNKYPLRFNYDPTKILADDQFTYPTKDGTGFINQKANALETFYEFPLKCLSPVVDTKEEYKKVAEGKNPKNLLDDPNNLHKLGLYDLLQRDKTDPKKFAKDKNDNYVVKRPEGLASDKVFKGWALDPAGKKMVWNNPKETMPFHATNLYAIWDIPDKRRKVIFDPNGGKLEGIGLEDLTTEKKTIKEGDIGKQEENTYPVKGYYDLEKTPQENEKISDAEKAKNLQVFTVAHGQKLKAPQTPPTRYGYDFLGWEVIYYKKDQNNNFTDEQDKSYREKYMVPELYSFGTDVVAPIYLKAIWVENKRAEVKVYHYYLKNEKTENGEKFVLCDKKYPNPEPNSLSYKRVDDYVPATGEKQDEHWILATNAELMEKLDGKWVEKTKGSDGNVKETEHDLKTEYEKYNERVKLNNTYFQTFRVQDNINVGNEDNPVYEPNPENVFRFYYRPFRTRNYKVNYIDERGKAEVEKFFKGLKLYNTEGLTDDGLLAANTENKAKFEANRGKLEEILDKYKVIDKEDVTSECRHYDARNYRHIPGWKLASAAQQQLFYDVNEDTNEFLGINGTGSDEIYFYYKDARVIEVPKDGKTPEGYVRVTFKIDDKNKGGVFKDKDGKEVTELHYDVIKGLKSDNLPIPVIWEDGKTDSEGKLLEKEANRYYITPDQGKSFKGWDNEKWLNKQTEINRDYTFTAYFDWSGMSTASKGLVRTEAFKDPKGTWTNDFAPKLSDLKAQLVWKEGDAVKPVPSDVTITFIDGKGNELTKDEDVFELVKEKDTEDKDQIVRTETIKALVSFSKKAEEVNKLKGELKALVDALKALENADPQDKDAIAEQEKKIEDKKKEFGQELDVSVIVYKNRYEALNINGDKPEYLTKAENTDSKDGGLKDVTGNYVKVTVSPTGDMKAKDNKVYYVNPKAWVEIPEVSADGSSTFINWTADKKEQNEESKENGIFDFGKRHKFTKDTIITPVGAGDVVEQEKGKGKPDVPKTYVKVIVKTTDKATTETAFEKTFWVNPTKDVTIDVKNPTGKENQKFTFDGLGEKDVNYIFKEWQKVKTGEADDSLIDVTPEKIDLASHKYTDKVTVIEAVYKQSIEPGKIEEPLKTTKLDTPQGKEITNDVLIKQITPQEGKEIESIEVISKPDGNTVGSDTPAKVIVKYKDGTTQGSQDNPIVIPVEVHKNIIPEAPGGQKPKDALDNYVKVTFKAGIGGKFDNTLTNEFIYYVSPEVEVDLTNTAGNIKKIPNVGYYVNGEQWDNKDNKTLKGTFTDAETEFVFKFTKSDNIITKVDENTKKPDGYVTVTFKTDGHGKVDGKDIIIYYVDPNAGITLKVLGEGETATDKQLAVPKATANPNYTFNNVWQEPIDEATQITSDRTHVAIFQDGKVKLTYLAGDGATGTVPAETEVKVGTKVRLANADGLSKANATFAGWKIGNETYKVGQEITLNENTTAIAQWSAAKHIVKFIFADGAQFTQEEVEHDKTATKPTTDPTLDGKVFMGWKENESDENYFDFTTPITADKTLIAIWQDPVQNINDGDTVEPQFIKVTFKQGDHGQLKIGEENPESLSYKVQKSLKIKDAIKNGMTIPQIIANNYYKVVDANNGWDKELKLEGKDATFTAQYEIKNNVVPVDIKNKTPEEIEELRNNKPEGTVVVEFAIADNAGNNKAILAGNTFFYVKKDTDVTIKSPSVLALDEKYLFDSWKKVTVDGEYIKGKFTEDTVIKDQDAKVIGMNLEIPVAGLTRVTVLDIPDGETGRLVVIRDGQRYAFEITSYRRRRKEYKIFNVSGLPGGCIKSGDMIVYWTEKGNQKSSEYTEVIK